MERAKKLAGEEPQPSADEDPDAFLERQDKWNKEQKLAEWWQRVKELHEGERATENEEKAVETVDGYHLSSIDSGRGGNFYADQNGDIDLAHINPEITESAGMENMPFRITSSMAKHVFDRHGKEFGLESEAEAAEFILGLIKDTDHVRDMGDGRIIFSIEDIRKTIGKRAIVIEVDTENGNFIGIKTAGFDRINNIKKNPIIWERGANKTSTVDATSTNVTSKPTSEGGSSAGGTSNQKMDSSDGKGTNTSSSEQANSVKKTEGKPVNANWVAKVKQRIAELEEMIKNAPVWQARIKRLRDRVMADGKMKAAYEDELKNGRDNGGWLEEDSRLEALVDNVRNGEVELTEESARALGLADKGSRLDFTGFVEGKKGALDRARKELKEAERFDEVDRDRQSAALSEAWNRYRESYHVDPEEGVDGDNSYPDDNAREAFVKLAGESRQESLEHFISELLKADAEGARDNLYLLNSPHIGSRSVQKALKNALGEGWREKYDIPEQHRYSLRESRSGERHSSKPVVETPTEKTNASDIKPIGNGFFGNIYNQFKGKAKEAFEFLIKHKTGDLLGVFHRKEIGDIDLVWGNAETNDGLEHIIDKHVVRLGDFASVDEMVTTMEDVINNGEIIKQKWDKLIIEKDGIRVVIAKNVRDRSGKIINTKKNWVVTSYDSNKPKNKKGASARVTPGKPDEGAGAVAPNLSKGKGTNTSSSEQANGVKKTEGKPEESRSGERHSLAEGGGDGLTSASAPKPGETETAESVEGKPVGNDRRFTPGEQKDFDMLFSHLARATGDASRAGKAAFKIWNLLKKLGVRFEFDPGIKADGVWSINKETGERTIRINPLHALDKPVTMLFGHELNHDIRNLLGYDGSRSLEKAAKGFFEAVHGKGSWENEVRKKHDLYLDYEYRKQLKKLSADFDMSDPDGRRLAEERAMAAARMEFDGKDKDYIEEEVVGDVVGEMLMSPEHADRFFGHIESRGMLHEVWTGIRDFLRRMRDMFPGSRVAAAYDDVERRFREAYRDAESRIREDNDADVVSAAVDPGVRERQSVSSTVKGSGGEIFEEGGERGYYKEEMERALPEAPFSIRGEESISDKTKLYDVVKGLVEASGVTVHEVSGEEAGRMLEEHSGNARLMGNRTDAKMRKIAEHYADKELDANVQAVVDVYSGARDNVPISVARQDGTHTVVMRQGHEQKAGTKHSLFRHMDSRSNFVSIEELAMIPEIIEKGERQVDGKRVSYTFRTNNGLQYKVCTQLRDRREEFTNFFANRKKKPHDAELVVHSGDTQSSARASAHEVSAAKLENNSETASTTNEKNNASSGDIQLLTNDKGVVFGWAVDGEIYLNKDAINPETPIHEYTHLWDVMVRKENPELWKRGVELMRQTPLWDEVMDDPAYGDIRGNEDAVASEVHSRLTGENGAAILEKMMDDARSRGMEKTADTVTLVSKIRKWLNEMFHNLKGTLEKWSGRELDNLTAQNFVNLTLRDIANGINPNTEMRRGEQTRVVTEANPMLDDYHRGVRSREDVMTFDEVLEEAENAWSEYGDLTYPDMDIDMLRHAKEEGVITVYSSKPIKAGVFVTPSRMNAEEYAGGGRVYEKEVSVDEVAWTGEDEGQYAPGTSGKNKTGASGNIQFQKESQMDSNDLYFMHRNGIATKAEPGVESRMSPGEEESSFVDEETGRYSLSGEDRLRMRSGSVEGRYQSTRNGRGTIAFTRKNPTSTYNAFDRYMQGVGAVRMDWNIANTGSRYATYSQGDITWQVRSANHTQKDNFSGGWVNYEVYSDELVVDVDISKAPVAVADLKQLERDVRDFMSLSPEMRVPELYALRGQLPSEVLAGKASPDILEDFDKGVKSVRSQWESDWNRSIRTEVERESSERTSALWDEYSDKFERNFKLPDGRTGEVKITRTGIAPYVLSANGSRNALKLSVYRQTENHAKNKGLLDEFKSRETEILNNVTEEVVRRSPTLEEFIEEQAASRGYEQARFSISEETPQETERRKRGSWGEIREAGTENAAESLRLMEDYLRMLEADGNGDTPEADTARRDIEGLRTLAGGGRLPYGFTSERAARADAAMRPGEDIFGYAERMSGEHNSEQLGRDMAKRAEDIRHGISDNNDGYVTRFSLETDPGELRKLESLKEDELITVYRNVQIFPDGTIGSPMSAYDPLTGERRELIPLKWILVAVGL